MNPYGWSSKYPREFSWVEDNKNLKYRRGDVIKFDCLSKLINNHRGIVLNRFKYEKNIKNEYKIRDYGVEILMIEGPRVSKSYRKLCNSELIKTEYNFKDILDFYNLEHDNNKFSESIDYNIETKKLNVIHKIIIELSNNRKEI